VSRYPASTTLTHRIIRPGSQRLEHPPSTQSRFHQFYQTRRPTSHLCRIHMYSAPRVARKSAGDCTNKRRRERLKRVERACDARMVDHEHWKLDRREERELVLQCWKRCVSVWTSQYRHGTVTAVTGSPVTCSTSDLICREEIVGFRPSATPSPLPSRGSSLIVQASGEEINSCS
jgi:hypothetical protein